MRIFQSKNNKLQAIEEEKSNGKFWDMVNHEMVF